MASSNQSAENYVRVARPNLIGRLQNLPLIVEKLKKQQEKVCTGNEVEAKPEKILDWVLNKGEEACYQFLRILDRERKSVLTPDLHTWICSFSFREEQEDDYIQGNNAGSMNTNNQKSSVCTIHVKYFIIGAKVYLCNLTI